MAVYTKINKKNINSFIKNYNIGTIQKFKGIKEGIENTNYFLQTSKGKFILTIYEKRTNKKDLPFFMKLMDNLNKNNFKEKTSSNCFFFKWIFKKQFKSR